MFYTQSHLTLNLGPGVPLWCSGLRIWHWQLQHMEVPRLGGKLEQRSKLHLQPIPQLMATPDP